MDNRLMTDTKTVKIADAEFTLRMIDRRTWKKLMVETAKTTETWRGAYTKLSADDLKKPAEELTMIVLQNLSPGQIAESNIALYESQWRVIKSGVIAHKGILDREGKEITLTKDDGGVVADGTIDLYDLRGYFLPLYTEVLKFNNLSDDDKKN